MSMVYFLKQYLRDVILLNNQVNKEYSGVIVISQSLSWTISIPEVNNYNNPKMTVLKRGAIW